METVNKEGDNRGGTGLHEIRVLWRVQSRGEGALLVIHEKEEKDKPKERVGDLINIQKGKKSPQRRKFIKREEMENKLMAIFG